MMKKLVMVRTTNNLHIIGTKNFIKNAFRRKSLVLDNPYFVDFLWNGNGVVEKIAMNTLKLLYAKHQCTLNTRHILFEVVPDAELVELYENLSSSIKQNIKEKEEELL